VPPAWRYRLGVRTEDSQSSNPGSIPGSATNSLLYHLIFQKLTAKGIGARESFEPEWDQRFLLRVAELPLGIQLSRLMCGVERGEFGDAKNDGIGNEKKSTVATA
jgi:hypothetical protein